MSPVEVVRDVRIPLGGLTLSADLVRPAGPGPFPALLTVLPYRNDAGGGLMMAGELDWFAAHGYAHLLVDPLGIGGSDGTQRPPFHQDEVADALAALDWLAAQPWCTGAVGMWGHSYGGLMTLRTAAERPAALRAILPVQGFTDPERDFVHPGGARAGLGAIPTWGLQVLLNQLLPPLRESPDNRRRWAERLPADPWLLDLWQLPPGDRRWRERAVDLSGVTVPALCVAGWRDLFCDATIGAFEALAGPKRLLVGPWMHTVPHVAPAAALDFRGLALRWFDHWLKDLDTGLLAEPPVTLYEQGSPNPWRGLAHWPPPGGAEQWSADGTGGLRPGGRLPVTLRRGADATVGALSGLTGLPSGGGLPLDQHDDDLRALALTGAPLAAGLTVAGRPHVALRLGAERPGQLCAKLADVDPDGRSTLVASGSATVAPGQLDVTIGLWPTCYRVAAGHRLRLVLAAADVPRLWPDADPADLTLAAADLSLPLLPDSAGERLAPSPPPVDTGLPPMMVLMLDGSGSWTVGRDHLTDVLEVGTGESMRTRTLTEEHVVATSTQRYLRVPRSCPAGTTAEGRAHGQAELGSGEQVAVTAQVQLGPAGLELTARVVAGGTELLARRWDLPATPP